MLIIGCDFHPSFQQIAYVDEETGEYGERRLSHQEEAVRFYGSFAARRVLVGMEATGNDRWFRRVLSEFGHDCWWETPVRFMPRRRASSEPINGMPGTF